MNEEEAESQKRAITADESEAVIRNNLTHQSPGPDIVTKQYEGELTCVFRGLSPKIQEGEKISSSVHADCII